MFFAVVMPALLLALIPVLVTGDRSQRLDAARVLLPAIAAPRCGGVHVNMPENLARAREQGVLKRVRGTPVPALDDTLCSGAGSGGFAWRDLAVLALWTVGGALVARRMSWQPRGQS